MDQIEMKGLEYNEEKVNEKSNDYKVFRAKSEQYHDLIIFIKKISTLLNLPYEAGYSIAINTIIKWQIKESLFYENLLSFSDHERLTHEIELLLMAKKEIIALIDPSQDIEEVKEYLVNITNSLVKEHVRYNDPSIRNWFLENLWT